MTISVQFVPGTASWSKNKPLEPNQYLTHDNGGKPYRVIVGDAITIIDEYENKTLFTLNHETVWIGESPLTATTEFSGGHGDDFKGNSILVQITERRYVFIGHMVYSFETEHPIIHYVSEVGNNDVPYPFAIDTEHNFYLMIENIMMPVPEEYHSDPYGYYYNQEYNSILNINELISDYNGENQKRYSLSYHCNAKQHYNYPWMKNLHAVDNTTGKVYSVSEEDYVEMMRKIATVCQYHNMNITILHQERS
jgi:hypothetical protein